MTEMQLNPETHFKLLYIFQIRIHLTLLLLCNTDSQTSTSLSNYFLTAQELSAGKKLK